jgi:hypothetical protein
MAASKSVTYASVITKLANTKDIDTTRAGKLLRRRVRDNFDHALVKSWIGNTKKNRDGNRYPATMPAALADVLGTGKAFPS